MNILRTFNDVSTVVCEIYFDLLCDAWGGGGQVLGSLGVLLPVKICMCETKLLRSLPIFPLFSAYPPPQTHPAALFAGHEDAILTMDSSMGAVCLRSTHTQKVLSRIATGKGGG